MKSQWQVYYILLLNYIIQYYLNNLQFLTLVHFEEFLSLYAYHVYANEHCFLIF